MTGQNFIQFPLLCQLPFSPSPSPKETGITSAFALHEERSQRDNLVIIIPAIKKQPEERKHKLATMDAN